VEVRAFHSKLGQNLTFSRVPENAGHFASWEGIARDTGHRPWNMGRPGKYGMVGNPSWCPPLEYCAATLPRCETHWKWLGCPKLANSSQPLLGRNSSHYEDMWRRYCCL